MPAAIEATMTTGIMMMAAIVMMVMMSATIAARIHREEEAGIMPPATAPNRTIRIFEQSLQHHDEQDSENDDDR